MVVDSTHDRAFQRLSCRMFVALVILDTASGALLSAATGMMCSNALGALRPGSWPANYSHPQAFDGDQMPTYEWAVTLLGCGAFLGSGIFSLVGGELSDRIGRKKVLLVASSLHVRTCWVVAWCRMHMCSLAPTKSETPRARLSQCTFLKSCTCQPPVD